MDLYYGRVSGNSARAVFGLLEVGAPFTPRLVDPQRGDNRTAEYLAVNPMGKIPALADGAFRLWESNAINWYAAEKHPAAGLVPSTIEGRAAVQRWLFFQSAHLSPACLQVVRAGHPRMQAYWKMQADAATGEAGKKELARFLPVLEGALAGRSWLEGAFTLADVAHLPHLALAVEAGLSLAPYPGVSAWLDRLLARPAWRRASELVFGG
jgi:glutathione S-transferase